MSKVSKDIWNREKDGANKDKRSFIRYFLISTAVCLVVLFVKKDSLIRLVGAGFTIRQQNREMRRTQKKIDALDARIRTLQTDRDTLEAIAREQYLFAEPGDDVFLTE